MRAHEVNKKHVKAGAPTGIAAANVEVDGTDVCAQTIHSLFDLDNKTSRTQVLYERIVGCVEKV